MQSAWLALEWKINAVMLASLCFSLYGACLPLCPTAEGGGTVLRRGLGEGCRWPGSSSTVPGTRAVRGAAERGRTAGCLGSSWVPEYRRWALSSITGSWRGASASLLDGGSRGSCWPDPAATQGLPDPLRCSVALCSLWLQLSSSQSLRQLEAAEGKAGQEKWGTALALAEELLASALLLLEINRLHEIKVSPRSKTP